MERAMLRPLKDEAMATTENLPIAATPEGVVAGIPNLVLRAEGALVLAAATYAYAQMGFSWWIFAVLFFAPDIFMLGYLGGKKLGAIVYNFGHTYLVPAILLCAGWALASPLAMAITFIWIGHIGFDRIMGYGLKYASGFKFTHLSAPKN
jgi:hypothetical protein